MWDRITLKEYGKAAFKANYWKCVLVAILAGMAAGSIGLSTRTDTEDIQEGLYSISNTLSSATILAIFGIASFAALIGVALAVLVFNPLAVGCAHFFVKNSEESDTSLDCLGRGFTGNYWNTVLVMFMTDLFIFLWALLFVIPGIIKSYSYRMVKYIIAENPDINYKDAITLSRKMMEGNKWRAFVLDLSFIGWILLTAITLGLVGIFYYAPYSRATDAELYKALRDGGNPTGGPMGNDFKGEPEKIIIFEDEEE